MLLLTRCCLAGTIDPNINDSKYIEYGSKHGCVQRLKYDSKIASCVIIQPNIALTAAHVIVNAKNPTVLLDNNKEIKIKNVIFPEKFLQNKDKIGLSDFDIAICHLDGDVDLDYFPKLFEDYDELDSVCGIAGFGITGKYNGSQRVYDGKRRAGSNIIDKVDSFTLECSVDGGRKTSLEFLISPGDNGGGLFIDKKLAGINSLIYTYSKDKNPNSDLNDRSVHVRISKHVVWIKSCIKIFKQIDELEAANVRY